jgi:hypothetical protein
MSEALSIPSFYNLIYLDKDSDSKATLPPLLSLINYNSFFSAENKHLQSTLAAEAYNDSYLVEQQLNTQGSEASENTETNHPGSLVSLA